MRKGLVVALVFLGLASVMAVVLVMMMMGHEASSTPLVMHPPPREVMPEFPWPPPPPSARSVVTREELLGKPTGPVLMREVDARLVAALNKAGYSERSYFTVPGGFALVTRLETIDDDAKPLGGTARFHDPDATAPFSLASYVSQLFFAPEGQYRMLVFVANDVPIAPRAPVLTVDDARRLYVSGGDRLSPELRKEPFGENHQLTVLVYEFRKGAQAKDVSPVVPGRFEGRQHLLSTGITFGAE